MTTKLEGLGEVRALVVGPLKKYFLREIISYIFIKKITKQDISYITQLYGIDLILYVFINKQKNFPNIINAMSI